MVKDTLISTSRSIMVWTVWLGGGLPNGFSDFYQVFVKNPRLREKHPMYTCLQNVSRAQQSFSRRRKVASTGKDHGDVRGGIIPMRKNGGWQSEMVVCWRHLGASDWEQLQLGQVSVQVRVRLDAAPVPQEQDDAAPAPLAAPCPVRFRPKTRHLRFTWIWAYRPSIKGSKLLFPVIKAAKIKIWDLTETKLDPNSRACDLQIPSLPWILIEVTVS